MPLPKSNFLEVMTLIRLASREEGVTLETLEREYGIPPKRAREFVLILPKVALPPEAPDDIVDVEIDQNGTIRVFYPLRLDLPMNLGEEEVIALRLALQWGSDQGLIDPDLASLILGKILKTQESLDSIELQGVEVRFPKESDPHQHLETLRRAIEDSRILVIAYFSNYRNATSTRKVLPYRLVLTGGYWYLRAYQVEGGEKGWRSFRLDRIRSTALAEESFSPEDIPDPSLGKELFGFPEDEVTRTVTRFSPPSADYIRERFPKTDLEERSNGEVSLTKEVVGFPYYLSFVLSYGPEAEALEPPEFRREVRRRLKEILEGLDRPPFRESVRQSERTSE